MKTPQEYAESLVNEYRMILMNEDTDCGEEILCSIIAMKCAKVAVNRLLEYAHTIRAERFFRDVLKIIHKT